MKITDYKFSEDEIKNLVQYRDNQSSYQIRTRFIALLMLSQGLSPDSVSSVTGNSVYTIEYWFKLYTEEGIGRLNTLKYTPKQPYLNMFQINQVIIYVSWENPRNIREVREYIREKFGVSYSDDAVRKLLRKRGLKFMRPKKVPGNPPSAGEQIEFVENYNKSRAFQTPDSVILFGDAMHLVHQAVPALCWGDPAFPPLLSANTGRSRLNILGAYNPDTCSVIHLAGEENCNAERAVQFFDLIIKSYPAASSVTLYLDNAKYFHAGTVREWAEKNPHFHIVPLPAYAPNLNLIERFWKFAKEKLVKNKYYKEYKTFRAEVFRFLNHTSEYLDELKKLMTEKFEIIYV